MISTHIIRHGAALANTSGKNLINFLDNGDHVLLNVSVPTRFRASDYLQWSLLDLTIDFLISSSLSSYHEKATEALCVGRIQTRLGVAFVSKFSA